MLDEDDLEECNPESDEWIEFEDCLLEAQHEHGMRPMTYAYPHSVDRKTSFTHALAFRKKYLQLFSEKRRASMVDTKMDTPTLTNQLPAVGFEASMSSVGKMMGKVKRVRKKKFNSGTSQMEL